jgi:hypothetical protein
MNRRNLLIALILGIAAAVFAMRTGEDREAMQFARQGVGQIRQGALDVSCDAFTIDELVIGEPNQTESCDLIGCAVTVDEEHGIKQEWHKE